MTFVGCDLHTRKQQVAVLDTDTEEVSEHQLVQDGTAVEAFYAALPRSVTVGIESTGYAVWFNILMQRLGHTLLVGDAAKIRAMVHITKQGSTLLRFAPGCSPIGVYLRGNRDRGG